MDPDFTYDRNESILDLRLAHSKERDYLYYLDLDLVWNMHELFGSRLIGRVRQHELPGRKL